MQTANYLFTYGTLMREFVTPMTDFLAQHTKFVGVAYMSGLLFDLGAYPAVVYIPAIEAKVQGNLFEICGEQEALFKTLDDYEGIGERFSPPYEYERAIVPVTLEGKEIESYTYLYHRPINFKRLIPSGSYLDVVNFNQFSASELMKIRKVL